MPVTRHPPHRPVLAQLTHTVPTLDHDVADQTRSARSVGSIVHLVPLAQSPAQAPAVGSPWPAAFPPCPPPPVSWPCSDTSSVLCSRSTPQPRSSRTYTSSVSPSVPPTARARLGPLGSRAWSFYACMGSTTPQGHGALASFRTPHLVLPASRTPSAPWIGDFGAQYPAYIYPCPTLQVRPLDRPRMARGQSGLLRLSLYDSFIHYSTPVYPDAIPAGSLLHTNQNSIR